MRYLDLFSGIGGFPLGIKQACEVLNIENLECVGFSEIDKYASSIYRHHFPDHEPLGDITQIEASSLPDFDLLVGGFPCQAFSVAGKRLGFADTRGTLFFEIARILEEKHPRLLLLENVKGLTNHDGGNTFRTIIAALDELGYDLQWQVLNSKNHGVPQNRERVFIVGHLRGTRRPEVFPLGAGGGDAFSGNREGENTATITARYGSGNGRGSHVATGVNRPSRGAEPRPDGLASSLDRIYGAEGISPTLNTAQGGNRQPFVRPVLTPDRLEKQQNGRRFKEDGDPSFTLTSQDRHGVLVTKGLAKESDEANTLDANYYKGIGANQARFGVSDDARIRRLTPTECERLQAFPDGWTRYGHDGKEISDTQRYKCLGNAVTVSVIRDICVKLLA